MIKILTNDLFNLLVESINEEAKEHDFDPSLLCLRRELKELQGEYQDIVNTYEFY